MMTDEEFINYCMSMHYLTPDQKLIFLKHLIDSMHKDYVKPSLKSAKEDKCLSVEEAFKQIREKFGLTRSDSN